MTITKLYTKLSKYKFDIKRIKFLSFIIIINRIVVDFI